MTNLIAITMTLLATNSVELKTNVTEHAFAPDIWQTQLTNFYNWVNIPQLPTNEKWVRTFVSEERSLSFVWEGKPRILTESKPVSTNTVHLRIKQEWEEVK